MTAAVSTMPTVSSNRAGASGKSTRALAGRRKASSWERLRATTAPSRGPRTSPARPDSASETGSAPLCVAASCASMPRHCRGSMDPTPSLRGPAVPTDVVPDNPRAAYRRQCRKEHVVGSIVKPEEEVYEATIARARGQAVPIDLRLRAPQPTAEIETEHKWRADRHAQSQSTRAEHAAVR